MQNYNNFKYNIYEENFLNEILNRKIKPSNNNNNNNNNNSQEMTTLQSIEDSIFMLNENEINKNYLNNKDIYNKNNEIINSIDHFLIQNTDNKSISNNYSEEIDNAFLNLSINQYTKPGNNLYRDKINSNVNNYYYNSFDNINNISNCDTIKHNDIYNNNNNNNNNFNLYNNNNLIQAYPINDNYNNFLSSNILSKNLNETYSKEDPNSKENLKKIEKQITALLFLSQKGNINNDNEFLIINKNEALEKNEKIKTISKNDKIEIEKNEKIKKKEKNKKSENDNIIKEGESEIKKIEKIENREYSNTIKVVEVDDKKDKINKKKLNSNFQLKGKPFLSRLISQLDSMVESDKNCNTVINNKNKLNNVNKNVNRFDEIQKITLNNKKSTDKSQKIPYNNNSLKNKLNNKSSQEKIIKKSMHLNKSNRDSNYLQERIEDLKLSIDSRKQFSKKIHKSYIYEDNNNDDDDNNNDNNYDDDDDYDGDYDNDYDYDNKNFLNNYTDYNIKKFKRKSFDDNKVRIKNDLNYYKDTRLKTRHSIANFKQSEKILTTEFYKELTQEINKTVHKIKAKPNDLKKREILYNYIKSVAKKIFPDSKIYRYGSIENGFSLTDGDIDICILNKDNFEYTPAECVEILGEKLKNNGIDDIKLLIRARVPIIKMKDNRSGISCDIGFQNRLAIQNTKLINAYSKIDNRFKQMVFISKIFNIYLITIYWSKMKNINEPYMGTLSSYCFILMIIHFLQIRKPPVLPNLQKIYLNNFKEYEYIDGFNVSFFGDINNLHKYWNSENNESLGELIVDFFKYYANDFPYISGVASVRAGGIITKEEKEWTREHQFEINKTNSVKDRYWFCVEDPFELTHNLGRPVDRKSLFKIRGEFLKAVKIINNKNLSGIQVLEKILEKNI
ncbi:hypothetical protein BCR32DRAFT_267420 [Anaeromyces robustus]|uniref:polynucleotide adenylyltransferase n=1 Tax=Anaeromyces robustus TaxID=1754192 RepID=A0A1Y1XAL7_9FUNG|nr:hypothetical protein BCR32DRAFT_267420 [Anaeromyces robustus]|eukprot:ORX82780.1 hypothetical protein BCR32DRAFT_267420 [Anaeromyces robustus]